MRLLMHLPRTQLLRLRLWLHRHLHHRERAASVRPNLSNLPPLFFCNNLHSYLFFQVLTLALSVACASICNALLCYLYYRPSAAYVDAFADAVKGSVRLVFRLVLFSHVTYCSSLVLIGFVYFPNNPYALGLTVTVFSILLACVRACTSRSNKV